MLRLPETINMTVRTAKLGLIVMLLSPLIHIALSVCTATVCLPSVRDRSSSSSVLLSSYSGLLCSPPDTRDTVLTGMVIPSPFDLVIVMMLQQLATKRIRGDDAPPDTTGNFFVIL